MSVQIFLGVDVGTRAGAYALIRSDFTVLRAQNFTTFIDFHSAVTAAGPITFAALELVRVWPGASAQASTTFMKNAGGYEAILEVLGIKRELVHPKRWQKDILGQLAKPVTRGLPAKDANKIKREYKKKIKETSIKKANERFGIQIENDGIADALNIALYGMRVFYCQV